MKLFGIWNIAGKKWVKADSGNDFKSAYEIANEAMGNMIQDGSAREGLELREYPLEAIAIETADTVNHAPTGETWIVAYVDGNNLCPRGWPETIANLSDCTLIEKATEDQKVKLIKELAEMKSARYDSRRSWALDYLQRAIAD